MRRRGNGVQKGSYMKFLSPLAGSSSAKYCGSVEGAVMLIWSTDVPG